MDQSPSTRFTSDIHHQVPEALNSAPIRENPTTYASFSLQNRATSVEPQTKEQILSIQKPPSYQRNSSNTYRYIILSHYTMIK